MKTYSRVQRTYTLGLLGLFFILGPGLVLGAKDTREDLVAGLKDALAAPVTPGGAGRVNAQAGQYLGMFEAALARKRYSDAEQLLYSLKSGVMADNPKAATYIDQLLMEIRVLSMAEAAERDKTLDEILTEASARFRAKAKAADFDPLLKRLATIPAGFGPNGDGSAQRTELVRNLVTKMQDYVQQIASGNKEQAANILNELVQIAGRLPTVPRSQLLALQAEGTARQGEWSATLEKLKKETQVTIDSAKSAADFDDLLAKLATPANSTRYGNYADNLSGQFESLRRFVRRWQDYYAQVDAGNGAAASAILRELAGDNSNEPLYPRSKILLRLNGKTPTDADPDTIGPLVAPEELTIDNIEKLARQLLARSGSGVTGIRLESGQEDLQNEVLRLRAAVNQLKLGNYQPTMSLIRSGSIQSRTGAYALALARVTQAMMLQSLPRYMDAPPGLLPTPQDSTESYLQRVIRESRAKADWYLVYRALEASQMLEQSSGRALNDLSGYRSFITALNQEKAGEWVSAVISYRTAMLNNATSLPMEEIARRLKAIQEEHPEDYNKASVPTQPGWGFPGGRANMPNYAPPPVNPRAANPAAGGMSAEVRPPATPAAAKPEASAPASPVPADAGNKQ